MASTLELLKLPPLTALEKIIQASLKVGFDVKYLTIGSPRGDVGTLTQVPLTLNKSKTPVDYWGYEGEVLYTYKRLDLEEFFKDLDLTFTVDFPLTMESLVKKIGERYGIQFDRADYIPSTIVQTPGNSPVFAAPAESLRWVGQTTVKLIQRLKPLTEVLPITLVDAMSYSLSQESLTPKQRLTQAINLTNYRTLDRDLLAEELHFGTPVQIGQDSDADNTEISVSFIGHGTYTGSTVLQYHRRWMPRMSNYNPIVVRNSEIRTLRELAQAAAKVQGFYLDPAEVENGPLPTLEAGEVRTLTLPIAETSLLYFGDLTVDYSR